MAEKERPGIMFYFDLRPCLKRLSLEEKGLLFEAMLDYAQYGVIPGLEGMTGIAWDFVQPRIDRDAEKYDEIVELKRKAARKRWDKQEEEAQTDTDECSSMQANAHASGAMQTMPTTTTTSTTTTKTTSTPKTTATPSSTSTRTFIPNAIPMAAGRSGPDRLAAAEEMSFEDLRQQKLKMLDRMMGAGP